MSYMGSPGMGWANTYVGALYANVASVVPVAAWGLWAASCAGIGGRSSKGFGEVVAGHGVGMPLRPRCGPAPGDMVGGLYGPIPHIWASIGRDFAFPLVGAHIRPI